MKNRPKSDSEISDEDDKTMGKTRKSRSRKRGRKTQPDEGSMSVNTTQSLLLSVASEPVGLIKKDFVYNRKSANKAPPLILQDMYPLSGLYAWSLDPADNKSLGDGTPRISNPATFYQYVSGESPLFPKSTGTDATIFARNSITQDFTNLVWPSYAALFESGLRDDVDITQSTFIRIIMSTHVIYTVLQSINMLIDMWKQASDNPSNELSRLILKLVSNDTSSIVQAKRRAQIESLSVKIGHLPVMPEMVLETRRMLTPFIDPALPETLIYTIHPVLTSASHGIEKFITNAHRMLDTLYSSYHDEIATLKTFIPTTVLSESAVVPGSIAVDPIRAVGRYNSADKPHDLIGSYVSVIPTSSDAIKGYEVSLEEDSLQHDDFTTPKRVTGAFTSICWAPSTVQTSTDQSVNENRFYHTIGEAISFIEVLSTTVYYRQLDKNGIHQVGFIAMTPHTWGIVRVPDDTDSTDGDYPGIPASLVGAKISGPGKVYSEIFFRRIGIAIFRNSSNRAYTRYPHYRRGVLDPNNLRASLVKIAPMLFNLPGVQVLDVSQAGKFISPTQPGVREAYKSTG